MLYELLTINGPFSSLVAICSPSVPFDIDTVGCSVVDESWKRLRAAKKPRAGADAFTGGRFCVCVVSVDADNNEKKKRKEGLRYIHVGSDSESMPGALGNAAIPFFLPDPSRRPPQLGFRALLL